jgi:hypothetical protein
MHPRRGRMALHACSLPLQEDGLASWEYLKKRSKVP